MKKVLFFAACVLFALAGGAQADYSADLYLGGNFSYPIYSIVNGVPVSYGGGSIDPSTLNGNALPWVYCADFIRVVYVPGDYQYTVVSNSGNIYGSPLNNAAQVAWLLTYENPIGGQGNQQMALQAAIWTVISDGLVNPITTPSTNYVYQLDQSNSSSAVVNLYSQYLNAVIAANSNGGISDQLVANFLWMTPETSAGGTMYQGLVTEVGGLGPQNGGGETPIPGTAWLLGSGLASLNAWRLYNKKVRNKRTISF